MIDRMRVVHLDDWAWSDYNQVLLTGGEPQLDPEKLIELIHALRSKGVQTIYLYTTTWSRRTPEIIELVDGIHYTLHAPLKKVHVADFMIFQLAIAQAHGSYRLYMDPAIRQEIPVVPAYWKRIESKPWLTEQECDLPPHEELLVLDTVVSS